MSQFKAAAYHFLISIAVVGAIITLMLTLWYPQAYFKLMGGKTLIYLIAGVDVFMGPLLTMAMFKAGKKLLKFDLTCIALLQVAAMSYGVYVMFEARPIFTVFNQDAFYVASVVDIVPSELTKGKTEGLRTASLTGPRLAAIGKPKDYKNNEDSLLIYAQGKMACRYPMVYEDYAKYHPDVVKAGKALSDLAGINSDNKTSLDAFLRKAHRPVTDFLFLPIYSAVSQMSVIVDAKTGEFIQIIDAKSKAVSHEK